MSRHSKWHKVRQFKGALDAKRAVSFTKLIREIMVAVRENGSDPEMNARLRVAIQKAREANMPKENIERALARGSSGVEGRLETLVYEAYAPGGTALIIECVTDNRNRTANEVKHLLSKFGGSLAASGSVTYLFDRLGVVRMSGEIPADHCEEIELALIDAGASRIEETGQQVELFCASTDMANLVEIVTKLGLPLEGFALEWIPKVYIETDEEDGSKVAELVDALEEMDDVSKVFSNLA